MRIGDTIKWRGVNKFHQGILKNTEEFGLVVLMEDGHFFPLEDLLGSHIKVVEL